MDTEYLSNNTNNIGSDIENICVSLPIEGKKEDSCMISEIENFNLADHTLDEYTFDIELPKSSFESYAAKEENQNKKLKVKNYSVTNAEFCKDLVSKIEKDVICNSESTSEAKLVNLQDELKYIKSEKSKTNSIINDNTELAIEKYSKLLGEIDRLFLTIKDYYLTDPTVEEISNEKKLIMSNLSLAYAKIRRWKESIEIDEEILRADNKFVKSYARLIRSHVNLENFHQAQTYANYLKSNFGKDAIAQYSDILDDFEKKNQAFEERAFKNLARKNKKKEEEEKLKKAEQQQAQAKNEQMTIKSESVKTSEEKYSTQQVAKKQKSWFNILFGGILFISSSAGLFFLYKYRKNFQL